MRTAIMQPYFFPYIGYFQLINAVDNFVLYDDVTFIKGGWINRNRILNNNESQIFGISLVKASSNKLIKDICIIKKDWKKLLKTIKQNYSKAPYFEISYNIIKQISEIKEIETIADLNYFTIKLICEYAKIDTPIYRSSELEILEIVEGDRVGRLVNICKHFNSDTYINAAGGDKLYTKEEFKKNGIDLHFIETTSPAKLYKQFDGSVPNLSIIDVLMFNNIKELNYLINCYYLR